MCLNQPKKCNFEFENKPLEDVKEYTYLGISFTQDATFKTAINELYKKGLKAYFKLLKILNPLPSAKTVLHLFDHLIKPILLYGCEIWGPCKIKSYSNTQSDNFWKQLHSEYPLEHKMCNTSNPYEKFHLKLCRDILGVNNKTSVIGIYGEL